MVVDPICKMSLDPAQAAASVDVEGTRVYFCSEACRRRFVAELGSKVSAPISLHGADHACSKRVPFDATMAFVAAASGLLATAILLSFYFGALTLVSGWLFAVDQFAEYWPFIVTLAIGFGIQVGLFVYIRRAVHAAASGKVVAATGTTSGAAMVSCCTHYLVNLAPVLGATGLVSFIGQYQVELFWFGIAANLAGVGYMGRRLVSFTQGAQRHALP